LSAFSLGTTTLLLFQLGDTSQDIDYKGAQGSPGRGEIAGHGPDQSIVNFLASEKQSNSTKLPAGHPEGSLKLHFALAVEKREDVFQWEEYFRQTKVHIHSTMEWDRGGRSVYFYDPDGHVGEIVSRGIWPNW
jgi:catechol 2,3-dioxygenase-like lactoylglutathione lyase family enzyme